MQVFLCDISLEKSSKILDSKRLNKQIVEAFQIVTDRLPNFHHPAYLFWKDYKQELRQYMYCLCNEYSNRFHKEHKCSILSIPNEIKTFDFIPNIEYDLYTHKVNLLRKNYEWYSRFFHVEKIDECPEGYYWNVPYGKNSKKQTDCWIQYFKLKGI